MYWPIGTPNVYAVSGKGRSTASVTHSDDGSQIEGSYGTNSETASSELGAQSSQHSGPEPDSASDLSVPGRKRKPYRGTNGSDEAYLADESEILAAKISRSGSIFATITRSSLTVWQAKPTVALATVVRSSQSMASYGPSAALLLRPDALIIVVQTTLGYLITYSLATDPNARVYATQLISSNRHTHRDSVSGYTSQRRQSTTVTDAGPGEGDGIREVNIRFRMVIRIDAGISKALALDDELVVATQKPAALQCIRWATDNKKSQASTELLSKIAWIATKCNVVEIIYDRPMNLNCWITSDGRAYAVQRRDANNIDMDNPQSLYQGFCFREPETGDTAANKAAINARFSLIAVGCSNGHIDVYVVKDYMGNIPLSHKLRLSVSSDTSGKLNFLSYSPDGYCLFAGYEKGWALWSVYGKAGANSFGTDHSLSGANDEKWLHGVKTGFWSGGGCEIALLGIDDDRIWIMDMARNALTGCYSPPNASRGLLHSSNSVNLYKGQEVRDLTAYSSDMSLWQNVQVPGSYLLHQWPIKSAAVSPDGRYIAVAGRRGLAHYSVASGRWRTFDDLEAEHEFTVRGGMCWHHHFLIACIETNNRYQIRLYSREKSLDHKNAQHSEELPAPAIFAMVSGADSLLVYTHDNTLLHYIIAPTAKSVRLVQVGQIGFHGIIRAPPRVRAISWILPEAQLEHGDPSQDVAIASVLFLVDGKLVLLQPSTNEHGELKYDMRVIAQNVEYYVLLRDQTADLSFSGAAGGSADSPGSQPRGDHLGHSLRDSLWYFDGNSFHVWSDIQDVMASAPADLGRDLPPTVRVPVEFYPISVMVTKGIIHGLDADLVQRKDINFSFFRQSSRIQLFLPPLLRYHLSEYNSPAALHLSHSYQHLPYFAHALEVLLHDILDSEVDNPPTPPETALLPAVISFISSFPSYLDIIVNCTRKTELRSWRTLFHSLPPALQLFEYSLAQGKLKTAAGYLLVLHTFEQESFQVHELGRLLRQATIMQDWELCRELARFLLGIDSSGETLRSALAKAGVATHAAQTGSSESRFANGTSQTSAREQLEVQQSLSGTTSRSVLPERERLRIAQISEINGKLESRKGVVDDYFSLQRSPTGSAQDEAFATPEP